MTDEKTTTKETSKEAPEEVVVTAPEASVEVSKTKTEGATTAQVSPETSGRDEKDSHRTPRRRTGGRKGDRRERPKRVQEFDQKIIGIRRVTRVMAGGRRFSFSVAMVIGDKKGRVGVGMGKAGDTALAIEKAIRNAKKNMITVKRTKSNSILHNTEAKYGSTVIEIRPAQGRGLVAGASVRTVLELAGVSDVTSKILSRSKNKTNIARATVVALLKLAH